MTPGPRVRQTVRACAAVLLLLGTLPAVAWSDDARVPHGFRTRMGSKFEAFCLQDDRAATRAAQCACLTDAVIFVSLRDNPGYRGYPDIVLATLYAYHAAMATGASPELDVRMILMGVPGNPAANPAQMIARAVRVNDEAVAMCTVR